MKRIYLAVLTAAALCSSCSKETQTYLGIDNQPKAITEIGASACESSNTTQASVSQADSTEIVWNSTDALGVFGENAQAEARNLAYTLSSGEETTVGKFVNEASDITEVHGVMYPYQPTAQMVDTTLVCEIPCVQVAVKESFDKEAAIMYSLGSELEVKLCNAVNYLKITISQSNVHSVTIGSDNYISGTVEITSDGVESAATGAMKSVTLVASGNNQCLEAGSYYIAVRPCEITHPTISYTFINSDHTATVMTKSGTGAIRFAEGANVKPISVSNWSGAESRDAIQLWEDGPYFATTNIGANSETKEESYYAWGGVTNKGDDHYAGNMNLSGYHDTAARVWGTAWRMPSKSEFDALFQNCELQWDSDSKGQIFKTKVYGQNQIFFPAAGYFYKGAVSALGTSGNYYTSTIKSNGVTYYVGMQSTQRGIYSIPVGDYLLSVRAVIQ